MTVAARTVARLRALDRPLALLASMQFMTQLGVAVMLPLLPLYAQSLGAGPTVLGVLVGAFGVALAGGQLASGFLTERFASRRLIVAGMATYALANVVIAGATAAVQLIAMRVVSGAGAGVNQVAERLYLTQVAERARLASANGILSAAGSAGSVAGPTVGGVLAAIGDLRIPFIVVGVTSMAAALAGWFLPQPPPRLAQESVPASPVAPAGAPRVKAVERPGIGRVLLVLFLVQLGFQAAFGAFITTYGPFADERLGWSTAEIGLVFSLFGLGSVTLGPLLARRADIHGRRLLGFVGCLLVLPFGLVYVAELPRLVLYPITVIGGAGVTTLEASWYALLGEATDGGRRGRAFGTVVALSTLGIMLGSTIAAQLWERTGDVGLGMIVASGAIGLSALVLLLHPSDRRSS